MTRKSIVDGAMACGEDKGSRSLLKTVDLRRSTKVYGFHQFLIHSHIQPSQILGAPGPDHRSLKMKDLSHTAQ